MNEKISNQDALKALRHERRAAVARASQSIKARTAVIKKIKAALQDGPCTVPEIAAAAALPTAEVMICVAGLRKYGLLTEGDARQGYYTYALAEAQNG